MRTDVGRPWLAWALLPWLLGACSTYQQVHVGRPITPLPAGSDGVQRWRSLHRALRALRVPYRPAAHYTMHVAVNIRYRGTAAMRARGAVAVAPNALRMMLLGPGGTTLLDFWSCGSAYRFALPSFDLVRRGRGESSTQVDHYLPVDFLRYWFLNPLQGRLLFADDGFWLLREPAGYTRVQQQGERVLIEREGIARYERIRATTRACGEVVYEPRDLGLKVEVACERIEAKVAPERAFADPDDPSKLCLAAGAKR